ncbi:MAG TPA: CAP domain-containing protein [Dehalococcoidia bacterium]|nr:CAP domain-containing protein [Dehalococcoidia bacterium]
MAIRLPRFTLPRLAGLLGAALLVATLVVAGPYRTARLEAAALAALHSEPALEQTLFELTNRERAARGLPALAHHPVLREIARIRSWDMANRGYFSHYTVEGLSVFDFLDGFGFRGGQGENIAYNYNDSASSAPVASRMFMNSPPHATQVLNGRYRYVGVGEVTNPAGAKYYTVVFSDSDTRW